MSHILATAVEPPRKSITLLASSFIPRILGAPSKRVKRFSRGIPSFIFSTLPGMNWNERITAARKALGINKSEFARQVGVSTPTAIRRFFFAH